MKISKILVPNDFSDCAINAIRFAKELSVQLEAELVFMTTNPVPIVHTNPLSIDLAAVPIMIESEKRVRQQYKNLMESENLNGVKYSIINYSAPFRDAIESILKTPDIDLIVIGTRHEHGFFDHLFGTHSIKIIRFSKVPVLLIPECADKKVLKKIGIALNFESGNHSEQLDIVKLLARVFGSELYILNCTSKDKRLFAYDDEKITLSSYLGSIKHSFITVNGQSNIPETLLRLSSELNLDLLFMHPRNLNIIQHLLQVSHTSTVARKIRIPLLTSHK